MRKAIFTCSHDWNSPIQIGDHHLARGLATRGWQVAFISTPISPLHIFSTATLNRRFKNYITKGEQEGNVWHYVPGSLIVPHHKARVLSSPWLYQNWNRFTIPSINQMLNNRGFGSVDLLCIRDAKYHFLLDTIKYKKSVYRLADRDDGFDHYNLPYAQIEQKVCSTVNTVLYTAHSLRDYGESRGARELRYFPHGVDLNRFTHAQMPKPPEYSRLSSPIAVYVGSIEGWFDYELLAKAANRLPQISFVVIGPFHQKNLFSDIPNIHLLGPRPYNEIPAYLQWADVGLIPFSTDMRYKKLVDGINPIKLYEYFAAGLPVISSSWEEIQSIKSPALLYSSQEQFINLLQSFDRSKGFKETLLEYAKGLDWGARVTELESLVASID